MEKKNNRPVECPPENDRQFLDRTGVSAQIRDALAKIVENRPKDPISFIADYFESFDSSQDIVSKAFQQLELTHFSIPVFETNVRIAFEITSTKKVGKGLKGVNGDIYNQLLHKVCRNLPGSIIDKLHNVMHCNSCDAVNFDVFRSSILTCYIVKEYVKQTEELFNCLDLNETGCVTKSLCDAVLGNLRESTGNANAKNPYSYIQSNLVLSPDQVSKALNQANIDRTSRFVSKEHFIAAAVDIFMIKVPKVR